MTRTSRRPVSAARIAAWLLLCLIAVAPGTARAATPGAATTQLTQRLTFARGDVRLGGSPAGLMPHLAGAALSGAPGEPGLPERAVTFVIPAGMRAVGVHAEEEGRVRLGENLHVAPAPAPEGGTAAPVAGWRQAPLATLGTGGFLRGWRMAGVVVRPLRYDAAAGTLDLVTSVRLVLDLAPADDAALPRLRATPETDAAVARQLSATVINPRDLSSAWRAPQVTTVAAPPSAAPQAATRPTTDGTPVDYVIVTVDSLATAFQNFADWKTATGVQTVVRTTSWIQSTYPGGADLAETIRFFLRDAYTNWGTSYALLGGDAPLIPYRSGTTIYYGGDDIPTDLYFACLDGNWNADGDSKYGEGFLDSLFAPGDDADLYPEIFVGRAPVNNNADVAVFVNKTRAFAENLDAGAATKMLFASEVLFPSTWTPGSPDEISLDGATLTESAVARVPSSLRVTRLYQNSAAYPGSLDELKQTVIDSLNAGVMFFEHMGHGYRNTLSVGDGVLTNPDADALTNGATQGVFYSVNCNSASFEFNSIAEHFILNANGGCIAYVGATRYDFPLTVGDYEDAFFDVAFSDSIYTLGQALQLSKVEFVPQAFQDNSHRWTQYTVILLGDPTLKMYRRTPRALTVAVPSLSVGQTAVTATVTSSGQPVAGAAVTLWKSGESWGTAVTGANGQATVPFRPRTAGTVSVGVAHLSDWATVTSASVLSSIPGAVAMTGVTYHDGSGGGSGNGDGVPGAGETLLLQPTLQNTGGSALNGVTASLTLRDPFGEIVATDSTATYGTLNAGASASGDGFTVTVAPAVRDGRTLRATLTVRDNASHVWQVPVGLSVTAPSLAIWAMSVRDTIAGDGDGVLEAGETAALRFTLQNAGGGAAHGVVVHLSARDGTTALTDSTQVFAGDLAALASGTGSDWCTLNAVSGGAHTFWCWVTDFSGRELLRQPVDMQAPGAPSGVVATGDASNITLTWNAVGDLDLAGYAIYRSSVSGGPYTRVNAFPDARTAYFKDFGLPAFTRQYYRIAAVDSSGNVGAQSAEISSTTNPPTHGGWPLTLGRSTPSSPVVANIDNSGDGSLDLVVGADRFYALHADGTELRDGDLDTRTEGVFAGVGNYFAANIALDDLDHDGHIDVIGCSFNSLPSPNDSTTIYVFDGVTGALEPGWPRQYPKFGWSTPACGDIDGDGKDEIVTLSADGWVYAWHFDGTDVRDGDPGTTISGRFAYTGATFPYGSVALADIDHDTKPEIVVPCNNGQLQVLNDDGTSVAGFPFAGVGGISASPAVADLFANGHYQILFGTASNNFYCVNDDGTLRWQRYPKGGNVSRTPSPAVADVNGDGALDVVIAGTDGRLYVSDRNGNELATWIESGTGKEGLPYGTGTVGVSESSPIVADIDGDGTPDVLMGAEDGKLYAYTGAGQPAAGFPIALSGEVRGSPLVWDVDGDGLSELALAGWDQNFYLWDLPAAYSAAAAPWPMFHHDVRHTGLVGAPFSAAPGAPAPAQTEVSQAPLVLEGHGPLGIRYRVPAAAAGAARAAAAAAPAAPRVRLEVFDARGRAVARLVDGPQAPGAYRLTWNAGTTAPRGVYFVRLTVGRAVWTARAVTLG